MSSHIITKKIILNEPSLNLSIRKRDGEMRIFDETLSEANSEVTDITLLEDRLRNLPYTGAKQLRNPSKQSQLSVTRIPVDSTASENQQQQQLPAFIRCAKSHPHTRRLRKCDPVSRYTS